MNLKIATGLVALLMFASAAVFASPGDNDNDSGETKTLTGCLEKGTGTNDFRLIGANGSKWQLRSDTVDFASHVGQTVTITTESSTIHSKAHDMKEDTKNEMKQHGMDENAAEGGHLNVTNLDKVSDTCTK